MWPGSNWSREKGEPVSSSKAKINSRLLCSSVEAGNCSTMRNASDAVTILKFDGRQHFRRPLVERSANGQQALDAGQVGSTLDGADLRNAQRGHGRQILQRPIALHAQHLDAMAQPLP